MQSRRRHVGLRVAIELVFEPRDERGGGGLVRPPRVGGRHHPGAQLPHDGFPDFWVVTDSSQVRIVERQLAARFLTGRPGSLTVAADAVLIEQRALRGELSGDLRERGRGQSGDR